MSGQSIRRSQFITTYGPGAILEGPEGPRVIHSLEQSDAFQTKAISDCEIVERRLSENILSGARIVAIPSNAELGVDEHRFVYNTSPFPRWSICVTHSILYRRAADSLRACPACPPLPDVFAAARRAGVEKTRFIQVCEAGHMQDVDWSGMVSSMGGTCAGGCRPSHFEWRGGGGALRNVTVRCPDCGGSANLGQAYSRSWRCSGDHPEERAGNRGSCTADGRIVQRGASNVFVPDTVTALTIPPAALELHRLLSQSALRVLFSVITPRNIDEMRDLLNRVTTSGQVPRATADTILAHPESEIMRALDEVLRPVTVQTEGEMRLEEYRRLRDAAAEGFPVEPGASRPQFEVIRSDVRVLPLTQGGFLRVTPVSRLRVVMVQKGYSRLGGQPVDRRAVIDGETWYPGVELFGEGLFCDYVDAQGRPSAIHVHGNASDAWTTHSATASWAAEPIHLDPAFVWMHTLSHRLMAALSLTSGYSSAAIRERIFVEPSDDGSRYGGVLLYTVQPGGDGTLGGLVSLVPTFERVIERAFRDLNSCSNDPLCGREHFNEDRVNGAACFACLFQSETSCEHRNAHLDRNVLLGL